MHEPALRPAPEIAAQPPVARRRRAVRAALARSVWAVLAALTLGFVFASAPIQYAALQRVCAAPPCRDAALLPAQVGELAALGLSPISFAIYALAIQLLVVAVSFLVGALLIWRKSDEPMAFFAACTLATFAGIAFPEALLELPVQLGLFGRLLVAVAFIGNTAAVGLFYVFPDGRFVPRWSVALLALLLALNTARFYLPGSPFDPAAWPAPAWMLVYGPLYGSIVLAQIYRYRRVSSPVQRAQTRWVVFGLAVAILGSPGTTILFALMEWRSALALLTSYSLSYLSLLAVPITIGVAVLRYRLWDIGALIDRTLIYAVLTGCIVAIYTLIVGGVGTLLQATGNPLLGLLATGLAAVLVQPLRERVQRAVSRMLYGERDEPYRALTRLGRRLEAAQPPEAALETIVQTVCEALRLPYAAILLDSDDGRVTAAAAGEPTGAPLSLPLVYQGVAIGRFVLASPAPNEPFSAADRQRLAELARQIAMAAHAARLTIERQQLIADLRRSRERLVLAREEERRRLRRDLHDGLGPTLAALTLSAGTLAERIPHAPAATVSQALALERDLRATIGEIRRLVAGLRPPALDELGLAGALRDRAARWAAAGGELRVTVEAPEQPDPLPAAVEVAAYRIVEEALTNVVRHAEALHCIVRLDYSDELRIEVCDDGVGIAVDLRPGVGLASMRERAEELGGMVQISAGPQGGTQVIAVLPLGGE